MAFRPCALLWLTVLSVFLPPATASAGNGCAIPPANLTNWWPANGNANDIVGGANGTLNGATFATGEVGQAFSFDGVNDSVTFGSTVGNFGTSDFTIDFWIRTTNTTRTEGVLGKREFCSHHSFWDMRLGSNGTLSVELDQDNAATNYNSLTAPATLNDGVFHLVAVVREGSTMRIYVDGVLSATGTTSGVTNLVNAALLTAGTSACTGQDGTNFFTGQLDELEIFGRALTQCEIQAIFNAGSSGKCLPDKVPDPQPTACALGVTATPTPTLTPTSTATVVPPTVTTAPSAPPNVPTLSGWALALLGLGLATLGFLLTRGSLR